MGVAGVLNRQDFVSTFDVPALNLERVIDPQARIQTADRLHAVLVDNRASDHAGSGIQDEGRAVRQSLRRLAVNNLAILYGPLTVACFGRFPRGVA